jgi:dTMP kinase
VADVRPDPELAPDPSASTPDRITRVFGSRQFFRLWIVQVMSATGDWLGFSAIIVLAARVGGSVGAGAGAVSLVLAARIVPGFVFGPLAGVLVDRWDRKRVMIACDLGRATVVAMLPFVRGLAGLVLISLALEAFTLLWSPAKEASVPKLVPPSHLASANSLSLAAAYGTFPFAALLFAILAGVSSWLGGLGVSHALSLDQMALAFYVDSLTFVASAALVSRLAIGGRRVREAADAAAGHGSPATALHELREGWRYIFINHTVRAVNLGLAMALIGGGMLIPLGAVYSTQVLDAGAAGYGVFTTALGFGVALGALGVALLQRRLPMERVFTTCLLLAGGLLFVAASAGTLAVATVAVGLMGVAVGPVYVSGFVLLQQEVDDELRGRVFSSLNLLVRSCVLLSMVMGPLVAALLGGVAQDWLGGSVQVAGVEVALPGVRLALWLAAAIIVMAGVVALHSVRAGQRSRAFRAGRHPSQLRSNPLGPRFGELGA